MSMKVRRLTFLWGALLFMVTLVMIYTMIDTINSAPRSGALDPSGVAHAKYSVLENKMAKIETDIVQNRQFVAKMRLKVEEMMAGGDMGDLGELINKAEVMGIDAKDDHVLKTKKERDEETYEVAFLDGGKPAEGVCKWMSQASSTPDINVHKLMDQLAFDNKDGGVWKQGYELTYPASRWTPVKPLKVVLIPHTHCDPGWIMTFKQYYERQVSKILGNVMPKLEQNKDYKFMFNEMSYFHWWWNDIDQATREQVKKFLKNGQFEISSGGWVMPDEANTHYYAMLDQLIEGHQWLNSTLGYVPQSHWSIDPFGYSSTMAYLLKRSEFKSMLIQRVHYSIKKELAKETSLEFMWRQQWDASSSTDMFTHMMPFYSYDVPHTCGPDPKVCCQFDFRRLPGSSLRCPWHVDPKPISPSNVAERSATIADQWKKKATLYKHDVLLVPLGDDFRYLEPSEFDAQFSNYDKIFQYLRDHPELGVEPSYGTLSDYFNTLYAKTGVEPGQTPPSTPSLSGDFFSYADRDDHYWSGYFTSRPLQKHLDRALEHNLRSAEIIYSLAHASAHSSVQYFPSVQLMKKLVEARRALGLFQHHDGITGTAKDFVMEDYAAKLATAMKECKQVIVESAVFLMAEDKSVYTYTDGEAVLHMDEMRADHNQLPYRPVMAVAPDAKTVVVYNSLAQSRTEVVKLWTTSPYVEVTDPEGQPIHSQTEPYWNDKDSASGSKFKVSFVADMPGLSLRKFGVKRVEAGEDKFNHIVTVTLLSPSGKAAVSGLDAFTVENLKTNSGEFSLESNFLSASFSGSTGLLKSVQMLSSGKKFKSELEFIFYGTTHKHDKSGAYLFMPDGDAKPLLTEAPELIRVIKGPITKEVHVFTQYIQHTVRVHNSPGTDGSSIDMFNIIDIRSARNKEVGVRIHTDIDNMDRVFYSDLNGFQMQKRKYRSKLTLQGNVYPMPSMAYLQDKQHRVSVLSAQSLGCANLVAGAIDVMLDRRLNQDDNRGLGQGVLDNHPTPNRFRLLFESRTEPVKDTAPDASFPSTLGHLSSLALIHPLMVMPKSDVGSEPALQSKVDLLTASLACPLHLLNLRTLQAPGDGMAAFVSSMQFAPKDSALLLLRHLTGDCSFPSPSLSCRSSDGEVTISELFPNVELARSTVTSLTMTHDHYEVKAGQSFQVPPMEITAVKLDFKR